MARNHSSLLISSTAQGAAVCSALRTVSIILPIVAIVISACGPSQSAIQTAIAGTQVARPTETRTPNPHRTYTTWYEGRRRALGDIWGDASLVGEQSLTSAAAGDTSQSRTRLDEYAEEVSDLLAEARVINPPNGMREIHALFVETLRLSDKAGHHCHTRCHRDAYGRRRGTGVA